MARLGLAIHEFLSARPCGPLKLVDPKAKPWDDESTLASHYPNCAATLAASAISQSRITVASALSGRCALQVT